MASDPSQQPDGYFIAAVLAGDADQFSELVRRYESALLRVARSRMGKTDWAEDVVQETFWCACKSLPSYDSRYSFRTWLWTILLNQCRRHLKRRSRMRFVSFWGERDRTEMGEDRASADCLPSREVEPPDQLLATEQAERLDALLRQLPEPQADALRLRFFGGLKFREIADAMECSLSTAKNRVRWGLEKMAQFLRDEENAQGALHRESGNAAQHNL